jgi:extracellular matrix regulatory protein A
MAEIEMVNIGARNYVVAERVVAILASSTAPVRRVIREAKERGTLLDVSQHRELRTVIVMDDGHLVASFLPTDTVMRRFADPATSIDAQDDDE